jgi:hypothetical protein
LVNSGYSRQEKEEKVLDSAGKKPRTHGDHLDMISKNVIDLIDSLNGEYIGNRSRAIYVVANGVMKEIDSRRYVREMDIPSDLMLHLFVAKKAYDKTWENLFSLVDKGLAADPKVEQT